MCHVPDDENSVRLQKSYLRSAGLECDQLRPYISHVKIARLMVNNIAGTINSSGCLVLLCKHFSSHVTVTSDLRFEVFDSF